MERQIIRFKDSKIYKTIDPTHEVFNGIDVLESALIDNGFIDESTETMLLSSYHMTYKKNGKELLMIRPFKSDWNIKIFGACLDVQKLFSLPVIFEFEIEKTGWCLNGMLDASIEDIEAAFREAAQVSPVAQLIVYPLSILHMFYLKNPFLFQAADEKTIKEVLTSFWEGEMGRIRQLMNETVIETKDDKIGKFLQDWFIKMNVTLRLTADKIHERMKVDREGLFMILSSLKKYMDSLLSNYRNSLSYIWHDSKILHNNEAFLSIVQESRETILLTERFLSELIDLETSKSETLSASEVHHFAEVVPEKKVIVPEITIQQKEVESAPQSAALKKIYKAPSATPSWESKLRDKIEEEESDWFEYIINNGSSVRDIPFRKKRDLFGEDENLPLTINERRVEMLVNKLSKGKRMAKEFSRMIKLLILHSNEQGYVTKETLKKLFMHDYENEQVLNDFAARYGIKKTVAHQRISMEFHVILEQLRKNGLVKEYFLDSSYQVYWNFAVYLHQQ